MNGYDLALVLHLFGILALFAGELLLLTALGGARRAATAEGLREWTQLGARLARITPAFAVLAFIPAAYMVSDRWGWKSHWVSVAMLGLLLIIALLLYPLLPRFLRLARTADAVAGGAVPPSMQRAVLDPVLWLCGQVVTTLFSGVVVLMVFKPDTGPALLIMAAAILLGVLATAPALTRYRRLPA